MFPTQNIESIVINALPKNFWRTSLTPNHLKIWKLVWKCLKFLGS